MKTPQALEVVGPKAFGYPDIPFTPLPSSNSLLQERRAR
jgi:DUF917 family protein